MRPPSRTVVFVACIGLSLASGLAKASTGIRCITALEARPSSPMVDRPSAGKQVDKPRCPKAIAWRVPESPDASGRVSSLRRPSQRA